MYAVNESGIGTSMDVEWGGGCFLYRVFPYLSSLGGVMAMAVRTTSESEMRFLGKKVVCNSSLFV